MGTFPFGRVALRKARLTGDALAAKRKQVADARNARGDREAFHRNCVESNDLESRRAGCGVEVGESLSIEPRILPRPRREARPGAFTSQLQNRFQSEQEMRIGYLTGPVQVVAVRRIEERTERRP